MQIKKKQVDLRFFFNLLSILTIVPDVLYVYILENLD
jgi:hypothetical protein